MHVVYSALTLFKERRRKKKKDNKKSWKKDGGGEALHKFYIHKAADKVIVASPKLFFHPPSSIKHFSC